MQGPRREERARRRRGRAATAWRVAALLALSSPLVATTVIDCAEGETASYDVATSCGPAGIAMLSFDGEPDDDGCCGPCRAFVDATGANAVGLPERGEILAVEREGFDDGNFALVGPVPLAGTAPPAVVDRICRFTSAGDGVLAVTCEGEMPDAECAGTLARRTAP